MDVKTSIKPEYRYTQQQDGWVYVPSALKKTDRFITYKGIEHGAHVSTRQGRFELRLHGQAKPQVVYIPFVSRTGYGTGECGGPKPIDLAPKVVSLSPAPGAKGVKTTSSIVARLSMKAKEGTANLGTFYAINRKTGEFVDGKTGRYINDQRLIVIVPSKPLKPNTAYDVTVSAGPYGVLGETGDPLISGARWSFTTGSM
jgi:hypothetical protein